MKPILLLLMVQLLGHLAFAEDVDISREVPGVKFHRPPDGASGTLVFAFAPGIYLPEGATNVATIFGIHLPDGQVLRIGELPWGELHASKDSETYCTVSTSDQGATRIFTCSKSGGATNVISPGAKPNSVVATSDRVFYTLDDGSQLFEFMLANGKTRQIKLAGATTWEYEHYDRIHIPTDATNILHFYYKGHGKRLEEGRDYLSGFYSLDLQSGEMRWRSNLTEDSDDTNMTWRDNQGRFIMFKGTESPASGLELMSSDSPYALSESRGGRKPDVRSIKKFNKPFLTPQAYYYIQQISPDGRFAFIALAEPVTPKSKWQPGIKSTYSMVDTQTGQSWELLTVDVGRNSLGAISRVLWLAQ